MCCILSYIARGFIQYRIVIRGHYVYERSSIDSLFLKQLLNDTTERTKFSFVLLVFSLKTAGSKRLKAFANNNTGNYDLDAFLTSEGMHELDHETKVKLQPFFTVVCLIINKTYVLIEI
jgi:hypothetical protein